MGAHVIHSNQTLTAETMSYEHGSFSKKQISYLVGVLLFSLFVFSFFWYRKEE